MNQDLKYLEIYRKYAQYFKYDTGSVTFYLNADAYFQFTTEGFTYSDSIQKVLLEVVLLRKEKDSKRKEHKFKGIHKKLAQLLNLSQENLHQWGK
jgi:hypothetical protein